MAAFTETLAEHFEQIQQTLSVLCAVLLLYALVRGTYYTHLSHAKLAILAVLLVAQVVNLFLYLRSNPRKAFNLTILIIGVDSILRLLLAR